MESRIIITILCVFIFSFSYSQRTTLNEAKIVAMNVFSERAEVPSAGNIKIKDIHPVKYNDAFVYYVVEFTPHGFVIVSGYKNLFPILAYSFGSDYGKSIAPPQFKAWVKQYAQQIIFATENNKVPTHKIRKKWDYYLASTIQSLKGDKEVEPMLISSWDQGQFYNQMCPADPAGPAGHCYTGCVATAMGQLCYYFRWPDSGIGSYSYQHPDYGTISANFDETTYKWDEMTNSVTRENNAVAELLFHLGVSVDMVYGPNGSGMYNHKAAYSLRTYFKYKPETEYLYRDSTNLNWDSTIIAHLDAGIPMYYAGWSVPNINGHAFIVDGYQGDDFFHFNWGWGGSYDGYFYLDELTPGGSNFNLAQELIINCYPDDQTFNYPSFCSGPDTLFSLYGTIDDGSGPLENYQNNSDCSWLIDPQSVYDSVSFIILEFNRLKTEANQDVIAIYDGPDTTYPLIGEFSGSSVPSEITSSGNKVLIHFLSNSSNTDDGWFISYYSETPEWCSGMEVLTNATDTFSDGSGDFYYKNLSTCMWNIQPENASDVTLYFLNFDTEPDYDKVKVYDAGSNELLATYSGYYDPNNLPEPVSSSSGKMLVAFSSNGTTTAEGWTAYYQSTITGTPENLSAGQLIVFPNPAKNLIIIQIPEQMDKGFFWQIIAISGNIQGTGFSEDNSVSLNLSNYKSGVYILQIISEKESYRQKIFVTK